MQAFVSSFTLATYLMARGRWPVDYDGRHFIFDGDGLDQDMRSYTASKNALNALVESRSVERAT